MEYEKHPEYAIAALLQMLARFPLLRCRPMAESIGAHLQFVAGDSRFDAAVREAALIASREWSAMMEMQRVLSCSNQRPE